MSATHPFSVQFKNIKSHVKLENFIEEKSIRLKRRHPDIVNCSVILKKINSSHNKGNPIEAQISLSLKGKTIVSCKQETNIDEDSSAFLSVTSAFEAAENAVKKHLQRIKSGKNRTLTYQKSDIAV